MLGAGVRASVEGGYCAMPFYSTLAEIEIGCPALAIYNFITSPGNWGSGRGRFREIDGSWLGSGGSSAPDRCRWQVLEDEPGRRWIVRALGELASVTITYSLAEIDGTTHVLRHMEFEVPTSAEIDDHARAALACATPYEEFLAAMKHTLERDLLTEPGPAAVPEPLI